MFKYRGELCTLLDRLSRVKNGPVRKSYTRMVRGTTVVSAPHRRQGSPEGESNKDPGQTECTPGTWYGWRTWYKSSATVSETTIPESVYITRKHELAGTFTRVAVATPPRVRGTDGTTTPTTDRRRVARRHVKTLDRVDLGGTVFYGVSKVDTGGCRFSTGQSRAHPVDVRSTVDSVQKRVRRVRDRQRESGTKIPGLYHGPSPNCQCR